jgi:hypothetical protein
MNTLHNLNTYSTSKGGLGPHFSRVAVSIQKGPGLEDPSEDPVAEADARQGPRCMGRGSEKRS